MTIIIAGYRLPNHPAARLADIPKRVRETFLKHLQRGATGACWTYRRNAPENYATVAWRDDDGTKRRIQAHRLAWMLANEQDIPAGRLVLHGCDTPACCNWRHLRVGSHADNQLDAVARGRWTYTPPTKPRTLSCVPAKPGTVGRH